MEQKRETVVEQIYTTLKTQIVTLRMMPGQLLMVQQLAAEYGISRTPVREALIRLKGEGLVNEADGRKFRVSDISWKQIRDIYQARQIVEESAICQVAENATDTQVAALREICRKMQTAIDTRQYPEYFELDQQFHFTILEMMGNEVLLNWMDNNADHQQRIRYCTMGLSVDMAESMEEHMAMVDAIERRDGRKAQMLIKRHLERSLENMLNLKRQLFPNPLTLIQ